MLRRIYMRRPFNRVRKRVSGRGNVIEYRGAVLSGVSFQISGNNNLIEIDPSCIINSLEFILFGDNHFIRIGPRCFFNFGGTLYFEDSNGSLTIGEGTRFQDVRIAVTEGGRVSVGRDCLFGYNIELRNGDSHAIVDRSTGARLNPASDIVIGDHVWVGVGAMILKGVAIPPDSVVAAGSVVTKPYSEPGIVLGGNPARILRRDINWCYDKNPVVGD